MVCYHDNVVLLLLLLLLLLVQQFVPNNVNYRYCCTAVERTACVTVHTTHIVAYQPTNQPTTIIFYLCRVCVCVVVFSCRTADAEEIRRAYLRLALCLHPDKAAARHAVAQQRQDQV